MDPASLSAAVAVITGLLDWNEVAKKIVGDAGIDTAKVGRRILLRDAANRVFLEIESDGEAIVLRTVPENPSLTKEHGVWGCCTPVIPCPPPPRMRRCRESGRNATLRIKAKPNEGVQGL
jgi:hypothetical protein